MTETTSGPNLARPGAIARVFKGTEQTILTATLALTTILLLIDAVGRPFGGFHVPGKDEYVKQLTLWLAFVGGLAAAIQGKHLRLSTAEFFGEGPRAGSRGSSASPWRPQSSPSSARAPWTSS